MMVMDGSHTHSYEEVHEIIDRMVTELSPKTDFDCGELGSWLKQTLDNGRAVYQIKQSYPKFLKGWISAAVGNNLSCEGLQDLPGAQRYLQMAYIDLLWAVAPDDANAAALCPETASDRAELGPWLNDLLHRIPREVGQTNLS